LEVYGAYPVWGTCQGTIRQSALTGPGREAIARIQPRACHDSVRVMSAGPLCPACGSQSGVGARFCHACGAALPEETENDRAARKVVTAIFCDVLGLVHSAKAHCGPAERAWEEAAAHARRAGDRRDELESLSWVPLVVWAGPTHVDDGLQRCSDVVARVRGDKKAMSSSLMAQAAFQANLGRFADGRELIGQARALLEEVALTVWLAGPLAQLAGWLELMAPATPPPPSASSAGAARR
jgi:hypothetical protein